LCAARPRHGPVIVDGGKGGDPIAHVLDDDMKAELAQRLSGSIANRRLRAGRSGN
jgi:hypothetical protein